MTNGRFRKLRETVESQQRAEADGGYAAGDGPYYDSDVLMELVNVAEAAWAIKKQIEGGSYSEEVSYVDLFEAVEALEDK